MTNSLLPAIKDVHEFHQACDQVSHLDNINHPGDEVIELRSRLIDEEHTELQEALALGDLVGIADGLADLIYVSIGTALAYGIPLHKVWDAVHETNMKKINPDTNKVAKDSGGKILKPPGWVAPNIAFILWSKGTPE